MSSDGAAHVVALRAELAGILRQEPVPPFHRAAAAARRHSSVRRRKTVVWRPVARRSRRRPAGAVRADQPQHPAGNPGAMTRTPRTFLIPAVAATPLAAAGLLGAAAALFRFDAPFLRTLGRARLLAHFRFYHGGSNQCRQTQGSGAAILLLTAFAARREQNGPVVVDLLAREVAQAISCRRRQAGIQRQEKPQLHGARHLIDVLATGARSADVFPFEFIVGNDDVRGDL